VYSIKILHLKNH